MSEPLDDAIFTEEKADTGHQYGIAFSLDAYRRLDARQIEVELNRLTARVKAAVYRDWLEARREQGQPIESPKSEVATERQWSWDGPGDAELDKSW